MMIGVSVAISTIQLWEFKLDFWFRPEILFFLFDKRMQNRCAGELQNASQIGLLLPFYC